MTINDNKKWPLYHKYNHHSYTKSHDRRKEVVLKEPREAREYRLYNNSSKELVVYRIDKGVINDDDILKCDYGIYTEDNELYLVELKGSDYNHAINQLSSTINILLIQPQITVGRLHTRVVLSKKHTPDILTTPEMKLRKLLKRFKGDFDKKSQVFEENV